MAPTPKISVKQLFRLFIIPTYKPIVGGVHLLFYELIFL